MAVYKKLHTFCNRSAYIWLNQSLLQKVAKHQVYLVLGGHSLDCWLRADCQQLSMSGKLCSLTHQAAE